MASNSHPVDLQRRKILLIVVSELFYRWIRWKINSYSVIIVEQLQTICLNRVPTGFRLYNIKWSDVDMIIFYDRNWNSWFCARQSCQGNIRKGERAGINDYAFNNLFHDVWTFKQAQHIFIRTFFASLKEISFFQSVIY